MADMSGLGAKIPPLPVFRVDPGDFAKLSSPFETIFGFGASRFLFDLPLRHPPLTSVHISLTASQCHLSTDWIPQVQRASISFVVPWIRLDISYNPLLSMVQHYSLATPVLEHLPSTAHHSPPPFPSSSQQTDSRPPTTIYLDAIVEDS